MTCRYDFVLTATVVHLYSHIAALLTDKEAASKPWGKGGVNTLSNKKCFVGRTVMIQYALHSPDLGEGFTYSERMRTTHKKFSTGF